MNLCGFKSAFLNIYLFIVFPHCRQFLGIFFSSFFSFFSFLEINSSDRKHNSSVTETTKSGIKKETDIISTEKHNRNT